MKAAIKKIIPLSWRYYVRKFLYKLGVKKYGLMVSCYPTKKSEYLLKEVLYSSNWNINYSSNGMHHRLEKKICDYVDVEHAIAVNTGGVALQMIFRALNLGHGDEAIQQVDSCVANAFAAINAGVTPIFSDVCKNDFLLDKNNLEKLVGPNTKAIVPIHLWGRPENMDFIESYARKNDLVVVEDACLALGASFNGRKVGTFGKATAFSFGTLKPIQTGEGAVIVTNDKHLAKELRVLRSWGDTASVSNLRDNKHLAWNGRPSEFVCAVALGQLELYDEKINRIRENVHYFHTLLADNEFVELVMPNGIESNVFTQVSLKLNSQIQKSVLMRSLSSQGIFVRHANFEPTNSVSFFKTDEWKRWILKGDLNKVTENYQRQFRNSVDVYNNIGIGIESNMFLKKKDVKILFELLEKSLPN